MPDSVNSVGSLFDMPASAAQEYICFHSGERTSAWNVAVRFRLRGDLEPAKLETAINRVIAQHEILRTGFAVNGMPVRQRIAESCFLPLAWFDATAAGMDPVAELDRISKAEARHIFDLVRLPLMRAAVVKIDPREHILLLTLHHAVCDGWSIGILSTEIMRAYKAVCEGALFQPDEAALQYADYVATQNEYRATPEYQAHAAFWQRSLRNLPPISTAISASGNKSVEGEIHSRLLPRELTREIESLARQEDLTFFEVVLSAFALARMLHGGSSHVAFATPVSGRSSAETETIIGPFVNYLPVSLAADSAKPLVAFRRAVASQLAGLHAHSEFRIEDLLQAQPGLFSSAFDHIFICQRDFVSTVEGGGVELSAIPSVSPGALHAMTFFLVERADGWRASCEIDPSIYSSAEAETMLDRFERVLSQFVENPSSAVAHVLNLESGHSARAEGASQEAFEVPASEAQQRYWMLQQVQAEPSALHLRIRLKIRGEVDPEIARRAFQLLTARHESLRTSFVLDGETLKQRIHPAGVIPDLEIRDISAHDPEAIAALTAEVLSAEDRYFFDHKRPSLLRVLILQLAASESILAITLPHLLADGWSCGLLLREFYAAYSSLSSGREPAFDPLPVQYADYTLSEQRWLESGAMQERLNWWQNHLPAKLLPLDLPGDASPSEAHAGIEIFALDPMLASAAKQFAREHDSTLFSVYGAALLALLSKYTRQAELSLVTPFANRTAETEGVIGPFATPVLVYTIVPPDASFRDFLASFQSDAMAAFENALPLERCVELTSLQSRRGRHAVNQISFFFQNAFVAETKTASFTAAPLPVTVTGSAFEWQFAVIDYGEQIRIEFQYDTCLWSGAGIRFVLEHYQRLLSECIFHQELPVAGVEIATEEERALQHFPEKLLPISRRALNLRCEPLQPSGSQKSAGVVAPDNDLERTLVAIWCDVFRSTAIGVQDDFFELGGHSLLLARIQAQLKKATGHRILAADIFAAPTIRALAERLASAPDAPIQSRTFPLREQGTQPPIFLISQSMVFRRMVQWLHPDQPVYTALMLDEDLKNGVNSTFEEIAAYYVSLIRSVRPKGPYRLGGWCVSSSLAYEIAQQFRALGETVDLLLLVDGWAPGHWLRIGRVRRLLAKTNYYCTRIARHARTLSRASSAQRSAFLAEKWRIMRAAAARQLGTLFYSAGIEMQVKIEEQTTLVDQVVYAASRRYNPKPADFHVLVFRSEEQPEGAFLPYDLGWSALLQHETQTVPLPGDHREIFDDPGAQILAQHIAAALSLPELEKPDASPVMRSNSVPVSAPACALANR